MKYAVKARSIRENAESEDCPIKPRSVRDFTRGDRPRHSGPSDTSIGLSDSQVCPSIRSVLQNTALNTGLSDRPAHYSRRPVVESKALYDNRQVYPTKQNVSDRSPQAYGLSAENRDVLRHKLRSVGDRRRLRGADRPAQACGLSDRTAVCGTIGVRC